MSETTKRMPSEAFAFAARFEMADGQADQTSTQRGKIKLVASSGEVFNARWWGPIVFDYSGVQWTKERLALDYCHDDEEIIGYADQIDTSAGNLVVSGELVSTEPGDMASKVLALGKAGVPYEASIAFDPRNNLVIEEWQPGTTATVNGKQIAGPVTVVRQCLLRGIAVCPHGADPYTESEFSAQGEREVDVTITRKEQLMAEPEKTPEPTPEQEQPTALDQARAEFKATVDAYTELCLGDSVFATQAAAAGKQLDVVAKEFIAKQKAAADQQVADLTAKCEALQAGVSELQGRLDSLSLGEKTPASSAPAEGDAAKEAAAKFRGCLPAGLAAFAAGIEAKRK